MIKRSNFQTATIDINGNIVNYGQSEIDGYSEIISDKVILEMVKIPSGSFLMGSADTEDERRKDEGPIRTINIKSFYLGKFPVTQAQWRGIMKNNPSFYKSDDLPVERVSWNDAIEFCQKLSEQTERKYRLPSEAEWEYACRAGTSTPFSFGQSINTDIANYNGNFPYGSATQGKFRNRTTSIDNYRFANSFGLFDMHGNVREWCQDIWQPRYDLWQKTYRRAPVDGSAWEISATRSSRIARGGSYGNSAAECRSAARAAFPADNILNYVGFRIASSDK